MSDTVQVLLQYGYVVLFAFVLAEQMVVPASSQTVAHATYSNVTRTVAESTDGAA